jgi:hypothetical protein
MTAEMTIESAAGARPAGRAGRLLVILVGVTTAAMLLAGVAAGAGTPDQSSTGSPSSYDYLGQPAWEVGQTFTAGMTGLLDRVDIYMNREAITPDAPVTVAIESASGNLPTGTILASAAVPATDVPQTDGHSAGWVTVTFSLPATVNAGTQYALVLSSTATTSHPYRTWVDKGNGYAGGQYSHRPNGSSGAFTTEPTGCSAPCANAAYDLLFKTYVAQPVPHPLGRGGYCASKPVMRADGTVGTFLDLVDGQPVSDATYAGAVRAFFGQGYGLTCDVLTGKGFKDAGYKVDGSGIHTGNAAADIYEYFLKP